MRPSGLELTDIFSHVGPEYRRDHTGTLSRALLRVMSAIEHCRTAALGGHSRLVDFNDGSVAFSRKDYRHDSKVGVMRLPAAEFTRRFLLHVLPAGLQRIRHNGLFANRTRGADLERCRELLGVAPPPRGPSTARRVRQPKDSLLYAHVDPG